MKLPLPGLRPWRLSRFWATVLAITVVGAAWLAWDVTTDLTAPPPPTFGISSIITATAFPAAGSATPVSLYPGTKLYLTYTVTNPNSVPIGVTSLSVTGVTSSNQAKCPASSINLSQTSYSSTYPPGLAVAANGGTASTSVPIQLTDTGGNQNGCEGVTFTFSLNGSAEYASQLIGACGASNTGATQITGTYSGSYTVANGQILWLNGGTITGSVTVDPTGQLVSTTGSTISGNVASEGGPVSLLGTSVGANISTQNAILGLGPGTSLGGNLAVQGGGPLCIDGSSSYPVMIHGNFSVQSLAASSTVNTICGLDYLGSNFAYQSNASPLQMGGSSSCLGNTIDANFAIQSNSAAVTIGGTGAGQGNSIGGNIALQSNTGGGTFTDNSSATGNCTMQSNTPVIVGSGNTVPGANSCNNVPPSVSITYPVTATATAPGPGASPAPPPPTRERGRPSPRRPWPWRTPPPASGGMARPSAPPRRPSSRPRAPPAGPSPWQPRSSPRVTATP